LKGSAHAERRGLSGAGLLSMAETWRYLAQQALWQDSFAAQTLQDS
jgi:hypothetical protein